MTDKIKKTIFLFAFSMLFLEACKKDEPVPNNYYNPDVVTKADIQGIVYDSTTLLPVASAHIYTLVGSTSYYPQLPYFPNDTTLSDGKYMAAVSWGGRYGRPTRPSDSTDIYIRAVTSNKTGYAHFKAASLIANGTITYNVYIVPIAYMKVHIKNTGAVSGCNVYLSGVIEHYPLNVAIYYSSTVSRPLDTTFISKAYPREYVYAYLDTPISVVDSVKINPNDTALVNFFY